MTQDEVIRMAREAGLMQVHSCCNVPDKLCNLDVWQGNIQAFFALAFAAGAAHEREACAKVCDDRADGALHAAEFAGRNAVVAAEEATECAAAIRAMGEK